MKYKYDVVSIIDQIGEYKTDKLKNGNKFCPYLFATRKDLLMKYLGVDWSPDSMPYTETFGLLTEAMLKDGAKVYEMEEDKSNIYFDGTKDKPKNLGYYHIRSGSVPAVLLAWKNSSEHEQTYRDYIEKQPKQEILRQCAWYYLMLSRIKTVAPEGFWELLDDLNANMPLGEATTWMNYISKFVKYHGL